MAWAVLLISFENGWFCHRGPSARPAEYSKINDGFPVHVEINSTPYAMGTQSRCWLLLLALARHGHLQQTGGSLQGGPGSLQALCMGFSWGQLPLWGGGGGPSDGPGCSETQVLLVLYSEGWPVRSSHAKQQRDTQSELVMLTSSMLWVGSTLPSCRVGILIAARGLITHSSPVVPFLVDCRSAALHSIGYRSVGHCASCLRCKMGNDGSRMK